MLSETFHIHIQGPQKPLSGSAHTGLSQLSVAEAKLRQEHSISCHILLAVLTFSIPLSHVYMESY